MAEKTREPQFEQQFEVTSPGGDAASHTTNCWRQMKGNCLCSFSFFKEIQENDYLLKDLFHQLKLQVTVLDLHVSNSLLHKKDDPVNGQYSVIPQQEQVLL